MKAWEVVGYTYRAETFCPEHIIQQLPTGEGETFDGWKLAEGVQMSTEDNLNEIAAAFGIIREEESSFDSEFFPKVIFASQVDEHDYCSVCLENLV